MGINFCAFGETMITLFYISGITSTSFIVLYSLVRVFRRHIQEHIYVATTSLIELSTIISVSCAVITFMAGVIGIALFC